MKSKILAALCAASLAGSAGATVVLSTNFEGGTTFATAAGDFSSLAVTGSTVSSSSINAGTPSDHFLALFRGSTATFGTGLTGATSMVVTFWASLGSPTSTRTQTLTVKSGTASKQLSLTGKGSSTNPGPGFGTLFTVALQSDDVSSFSIVADALPTSGGYLRIDDVTGTIPAPSTALLMLPAIAAVAGARLRRRKPVAA